MMMKKNLLIVCLTFACTTIGWSQNKLHKDLLYGDLTYGFETNIGNTGFLMGLGYQRNLSRKFIFQADIHNFRTGIADNNWADKKEFPKEEWLDHSAFLSVALGYAVIGKTDKFNITVKGGFSLCHIKTNYLDRYESTFYPNGTPLPVFDPGYKMRRNYIHTPSGYVFGTFLVTPSTITYNTVNKIGAGYNIGLDVNFPIINDQFLTLGFLSISQENPLQYLFFPIPVITYKIIL